MNNKCFISDNCNKSLTAKPFLNVQKRTHSGELLKKCKKFKRNFAQKGNLTQHMLYIQVRKNFTVCLFKDFFS